MKLGAKLNLFYGDVVRDMIEVDPRQYILQFFENEVTVRRTRHSEGLPMYEVKHEDNVAYYNDFELVLDYIDERL